MVIIGEVGVLLFVVLLYVVPTELTEYTEAYGLKLFESTEWPTLREARIHRNECLRRYRQQTMLNLGDATQAINWRRTMLNLGNATQAINSVPSVV